MLTRDKVFIIAEAGSNWRSGTPSRDLAMARALIDVAAEAGADACKFQTYRPETVYVENAGTSDYLSDAGIKEDIWDIFADLSMPYEMVPKLADYCARRGILFMSTPFSAGDFAAVDPYVKIHKVASYEISHVRLIELAARSGKPMVLSTGASDEDDIEWAVSTFRENNGTQLAVMQCTARYPASLESLNLKVVPWLEERFDVIPGFSDHSRDPLVGPLAAVALGARVIEKHYTLDNRLPGPDHSFALNPAELKAMVQGIRNVELCLGDGSKRVLPDEIELATYARRGVQASRAIAKGDVLEEDVNIAILRPGRQTLGVHPKQLTDIEGRRATREINVGEGIRDGDWE